MLKVIREKANKAVHGNFVAEVFQSGQEYLVTVKHFNIDEDPCAGQSQVVSELYKALGACDLDGVGFVSHSGGYASIRAKEGKSAAIKMILEVMNDGSRIDRFLKKSGSGVFYVSDDSEGGIKLPVCYDSEPTEEDAEHFINQLN